MSKWLIVHTPRGPRVWPIGDPPPERLDELVLAARDLAGVAAGSDWVRQGAGFDLLVTEGIPHKDLMATAIEGTLGELELHAATPAAANYRQEHARLHREARVREAEAVLAGMSAEEVDAVIARRTGGAAATDSKRTTPGR